MRKLAYLFIVPICLLLGCKNTDQAAIDNGIIQQYISSHHLTATAYPNGLYYVLVADGTGNPASTATLVSVAYKGYLTNGSVFDQSTSPFTTHLSNVIAGWQEGIPLMKRGGKATLLIPSALGYGSQAQSGIPANSVLIFDVTLISYQ